MFIHLIGSRGGKNEDDLDTSTSHVKLTPANVLGTYHLSLSIAAQSFMLDNKGT